MGKVARFYGFSYESQLNMRVSVWVDFVKQIPEIQKEEIAILASVLEPVILSSLAATTYGNDRKKNVTAILKMLDVLKGGVQRKRKEWTGRLSEEASKKLDAQIAALSLTEKSIIVKRE